MGEIFEEALRQANEVIDGHGFRIEKIQNNYYGDEDPITNTLLGVFTSDSHLIGIVDRLRALCICTDIRFNSRLEILFQDIMECFSIDIYACSMQDYRN